MAADKSSAGVRLQATTTGQAGAKPTASQPQSEPHWSLKPMAEPPLPKVRNTRWARTPIDQFILAQLESKGLAPSPPADKRTLLRRVYFDLIGLPPTPEQMAAFLADRSARAYEKVVDELLASPRYGERWARHWLDVAHYAETHGHDQDRVRTNSWPYRDYVIESFNSDKPYARFVQEQVAGDGLFPEEPRAIVALGFLATGPWDESSLRDIREDTIDRQIARYLDRDDIVTTVMNTFVSATVQCARCHNHKFDPISQQEYYGLQAVFAATDKANRAYDPDPAVHRQRRALLKQKDALAGREASFLVALREPAFQKELAAWENSLSNRVVTWSVLDAISFVSTNGATLAKQSDGSILATGKRPETDTYFIEARPDSGAITGVRLEVLADESLPHRGPGRQENGNLHLTDFHVFASTSEASSETPRELRVKRATADFNQQGWGIERAIDSNPKTAWGIYPEVGKAHQAVFEFQEPFPVVEGAKLTFVLAQDHGGGHLIGRARLSATTNAPPIGIDWWPERIARILARPAPQRTAGEQTELALYYANINIERKLAALPEPKLVFAGASDFAADGSFKPALTPRPIHVLKRGDINKPGELARPGALSCVPGLNSSFELADTNDERARRAALARWITDPANTLTWRSIVNRIWHYHFGRGLVDSPNDFGRMGGRPTHPELLDWLALHFLQSGGSIKALHRLIVTSEVYRQASSAPDAKAAAIDADNRLLWRMNRSRLDAESVRDTVLQISGLLDLKMGGPAAMQFVISPGVHVTPVVDYAKFDVDSPASRRRSVYRCIFRTLPDPFMDTLDCADASQLTASRSVSVTALQALAMLNDHFIVRYSEHFAERVGGMGKNLDAQIAAAYELALNRTPTREEAKELAAYARKHGLANLCRLILNSNEFMFVN
jgi:hypothetical protein